MNESDDVYVYLFMFILMNRIWPQECFFYFQTHVDAQLLTYRRCLRIRSRLAARVLPSRARKHRGFQRRGGAKANRPAQEPMNHRAGRQ